MENTFNEKVIENQNPSKASKFDKDKFWSNAIPILLISASLTGLLIMSLYYRKKANMLTDWQSEKEDQILALNNKVNRIDKSNKINNQAFDPFNHSGIVYGF